MAMLAEPRRKQKVINLRAKNNAWSNDNNKFGQRMLEKMGWTSGKGLGANENGITEHVVARYKNDEKGLGFEDKNDQWTKHEDDFNTLLANLSNATNSTENLHSGISLEDKSKKSKARIHYHKFTRGKDISRYSEKDLANIFGKKSFKSTEQVNEPLKEDLKTTEQIFTEKGSMKDYFKSKMAMFKSKSSNQINQNVSTLNENDADYDEPQYCFKGFSQETINDNTESFNGFAYNQEDETIKVTVDDTCSSNKLKKKKKKSKILADSENQNDNLSNTERECLYDNIEYLDEKIKKKKVPNKIEVQDNEGDLIDIKEETGEKIKKKKSKSKLKEVVNDDEKKSLDCLNDHENSIENTCDLNNIVTKKKKSSKCINNSSQNMQILNVSDNEQDQSQSSNNKKKKSSKNTENCEENQATQDNMLAKKKSKRKNDQNMENVTDNKNDVEHVPKKKKKRKSKD